VIFLGFMIFLGFKIVYEHFWACNLALILLRSIEIGGRYQFGNNDESALLWPVLAIRVCGCRISSCGNAECRG